MAAPTSPARRAAVVYNPVKVDVDELRATVDAAAKDAGWGETLWLETSVEDPGIGQAREAAAQGAEVVLAAGGDGTVRAVAEGLRDSDAALALLPSGTGNLLARNLELTLNHLGDSVRTAFTGKDRPVDLGIAELRREDGSTEEHAFLVMAGIGIDAKMIANSDEELKKRVGWIAYIDAIRKAVRDSNSMRVKFRVDDGPTKAMTAHTVLVGNCGSLPGNILLLPEAAVDDGLFDIVSLRPESFVGWAQVWVKIFWENGVLRRSTVGRKLMGMTREVRALRYLKAARFELILDHPEEFELDGDDFGMVTGFRCTVDAGAVRIRIPEDREIDVPDPEEVAQSLEATRAAVAETEPAT
ncbi:diacylglycerol/lipid kinase family protein [Pseudolysinimonas sp.]|jgi:diacylglycerol kinase (ATP)|uniref:diacylglycerol/lipid kinase family protein n=1 Tax=Pseudolysinimonas sp. TaxID=2680009 RepID=UPI00378328CE